MALKEKLCEICKNPFVPKNGKQLTCSNRCSEELKQLRTKQKAKYRRRCRVCHGMFKLTAEERKQSRLPTMCIECRGLSPAELARIIREREFEEVDLNFECPFENHKIKFEGRDGLDPNICPLG